jgi:hypothetical protein
LPPAAPAPESGCSVPILYGLAWPNAARHGAGTSMVAPIAPAPYPTNRRRVTLPLYQNSSPLCAPSLSVMESSLIQQSSPEDLFPEVPVGVSKRDPAHNFNRFSAGGW